MQDPFPSVQAEVNSALQTANRLYSEWTAALTSDSSASFRNLTQNLNTCLQGIEIDVSDLTDTVQMVEQNPGRFNLSLTEINNRKKFILDTRQRIVEMRNALNSPQANKKAEEEQRRALFKSAGSPVTQQTTRPTNASNFVESEKQMQQQIMFKQDEQLDDVMQTVGTLKEVAVVMGREIEDQSKLLDEMEVQVDSTQNKLQAGVKRVNDFIKANADTKQQWTIFCLIIVLIILLVLIFSI